MPRDLIMCNTLRQPMVIGKTAGTRSIVSLAGDVAGSTALVAVTPGRKIV